MARERINSVTAEEYVWRIRIRCSSHLDGWIKDCFSGLTITHQENGSTLLRGELMDMAAFYGLMMGLRDTGIMLLSLQAERIERHIGSGMDITTEEEIQDEKQKSSSIGKRR